MAALRVETLLIRIVQGKAAEAGLTCHQQHSSCSWRRGTNLKGRTAKKPENQYPFPGSMAATDHVVSGLCLVCSSDSMQQLDTVAFLLEIPTD